jgi:hypothetical protein
VRRAGFVAPVPFDALKTWTDALIYKHAACQRGIHFCFAPLLRALDFLPSPHDPILGMFQLWETFTNEA